MKIIGNKKYPTTVEGVMAKATLGKMFREQLKAEHNLSHLEFLEARFDPMELYRRYLDRNAPDAINVSNAIFEAASALKDKWEDAGWSKVVDDARDEVDEMLCFDSLGRFYNSAPFKAYHEAQGGTPLKLGDAPFDDEPDRLPPKIVQAAKRLDIENVEGLRLYIGALEQHGAEKAKPAGQKLLRAEGLSIKLATVNEFLFRAGFAKRSKAPQPEPLGAAAPQVKLNKKVLQVCGFENLRGDKPMGRIRDMILAIVRRDKRAAEMVFAKILKDEPKTSLLHNDKFADLIKRMKKRKAFELVR